MRTEEVRTPTEVHVVARSDNVLCEEAQQQQQPQQQLEQRMESQLQLLQLEKTKDLEAMLSHQKTKVKALEELVREYREETLPKHQALSAVQALQGSSVR